jgi:hypothetical protein
MVRRRGWLSVFSLVALSAGLSNCSAPPSQIQATLTAIYQANQNQQPAAAIRVSETPFVAATGATTQVGIDPLTPIPTVSPSPLSSPIIISKTAEPTDRPDMGTPTRTPQPRKTAKYWSEWPIVPSGVSDELKALYQKGLQMGNDAHAFSTIGDCQSVPDTFMGVYDTDRYRLGDSYAALEETIRYFKGNFGRQSITVRNGQSVASVFSPAWADPKLCNSGETPMDCEFRIHKPSIVFINLGTNWRGGDAVSHAQYLQKIVDYTIAHGAVPVLSSNGDNLEGDYRLNKATAQVAYEDDLPFWNFWASIRDLPGKGIDDSTPGEYLTPAAWARRSFTGLETLDAVWRAVTEQ